MLYKMYLSGFAEHGNLLKNNMHDLENSDLI